MSLLDVTKDHIEKFLEENHRSMIDPEYYYGVDNNQDTLEVFERSKLKVLCCFMSPGATRAVSNTFNAISWLMKSATGNRDDVFVDAVYFPENDNRELFKQKGVPYSFGNVSHMPVREYDLICVSMAIMPEVLNIPLFLEGNGIPFTCEEREKDQRVPPILYGGAASNEAGIILGEVKDKNGESLGHSLIDIANYGYGEEVLPELMRKLIEYKEEGGDTHDKSKLINWLLDNDVLHDNLFFPKYYSWEYKEDRFSVKEMKKLDERVPDRVVYNRIQNEEFDGFPLKTFHLSGENADSHDIMISSGCSGSSSTCSFCMEASVAGNYHERSLPEVEKDMAFVRKTCAPNTISWYSYNLNYYGHFMDLIEKGAEYFAGTTLLNERLDIIAHAPDQLKLAKQIGLKRVSGAIEGYGNRVRNEILNKNLPRETLMQAARNIFNLKLMHFKFGMIVTGQETDEDIEDFMSEVDEMIKIREECGANTSLQINNTPLVFYSQIALRYLPRITAESSYNNSRTMGKFIDFCKQRGIRCKFNGKGPGTWIEQMLLDFGPAGTDALVAVTTREGSAYYRNFGKKDKAAWEKVLSERGYDPLFFTFKRPLDYIFPNDHIIYATDEVIQMWKDRTERMNFDTRLCLNTLANPDPKCYGCKMCKPEHIPKMVKRDFDNEHTLEQVLEALSDSRHVDTTRVVVQQKQDWDFYHRDSLEHYIAALFLQESEELEREFYSVGKNTLSWVSNQGQKGWFGGTWAFDINWKRRVSDSEIRPLIERVNEKLHVCQVKEVFTDSKSLMIKRETDVSYLGVTSKYSMSQLKDMLSNFDWSIKVAVKSMGGGLDFESKYMPEMKERLLIVPKGSDTLLYMSVPSYVSPYLVMSSITRKGYDKMLNDFQFRAMDQGKEIDGTCSCGKHVTYSMFSGKNKKVCQICEGKRVLARMTGRV